MGYAENKVGGSGRPKMAREASIYRKELGFEGLGAFRGLRSTSDGSGSRGSVGGLDGL